MIGGMSWESTAVYYRRVNEQVREALGGLNSADVVLRSVNFHDIVTLQKLGAWEQAAGELSKVAKELEQAGADMILICTNTMHLLADEVQASVGVPLIHIADVTGEAIADAGCRRPLLLATRYTMEHGFYAERMKAHGIDLIVPDADGRRLTHQVIFDELCAGKVLDASRGALMALIEKAKAEGADAVILGCTEICLILDPANLPVPGFDSTTIHAEAAVEFSLGKQDVSRAAYA